MIEQSGEGASLIEAWRGARSVFVIDAARSSARPGTIHRIEAHAQKLPKSFSHHSTHALSLADAVELARALKQMPPRLVVYGVEGRSFAAGVGLSAEVEQAAGQLEELISAETRLNTA